MDVVKAQIKMKNINWGEILSFLIPVTWASLLGAAINAAFKVLKVFKDKDEKITKGFLFSLIFESIALVLFGILFGGLARNFTDDIITIMAAAAFGGAFGEKLYQKFSKKVDSIDSLSDLSPTAILTDTFEDSIEEESEKKNTKTQEEKPI